MSKKGNKNQQQKKQVEIVDQQKDPMLRALQKKVRNINKKLNQITQLSQKKDLKPEQEQKISKKAQITQEKEKYLEMIEVYKEIASENQKLIRKTQLNQLEDLALVIALKQYNADLGFLFNQNVDNLVRILTTPTSNDLTLQDRIKQISTSLTEAANNHKLKKSVKQYAESNGNLKKKVANETLSNQPQPISPRSQKQREQEIKQLQEQQAHDRAERQKVLNQPLTPQVAIQPPTLNDQLIQATPLAVLSVVAQAPKQQQEANPVPQVKNTNQQTTEPNPKSEVKGQERQRRQPREYRGGRGRGRNEGGREGRNYDERRYNKKPNFKPKYENENPKDRQLSSSSESSQEPKARQFKRQEVRELIQDGFIVVGKPKQKGKDQKQYYDHQHGNKHHRHHTKKNY